MSNRGKTWLPEHNELLVHNIEKTNAEIAVMLGRGAWAVECHRVTLAIELRREDSTLSVEACIARFKADAELVHHRMEKNTARARKRSRTCVDEDSMAIVREQVAVGKTLSVTSDTAAIAAVAECIRINQGSLAEAWANPDFVPILIKHHSGFEAFSASLTQKHHPINAPPAQRAPPVDLPQARGARQAEPAVAAREERCVGSEVGARVA